MGGRGCIHGLLAIERRYATTKEVTAEIGSAPKRKDQHTIVQRRGDDVPGCLIDV